MPHFPRRRRRASGEEAPVPIGGPAHEGVAGAAAPAPAVGVPPRPLGALPVVRAGAAAWAIIGLLLVAAVALRAMAEISVVVVPLFLALFPAALLVPARDSLRRAGAPPGLAALVVVIGSIGLLVLVGRLLAPQVAAEVPGLVEQSREGFVDLQGYLASIGIGAERLEELVASAREAAEEAELGQRAVSAAVSVAEGIAGLLFGLVALFFYLKDGERIAAWLRDLFPRRVRPDVQEIGCRAWFTFGAYFRGQLLVALVDALFIGLGLALLRVPLALPLAVIVFFGGLFPIVGGLVSGAVAVLVALATGGPVIALAVLALVVAVQQLESNILAPIVLGKATELHPLAVIVALTVGGVTLGILGAFIGVPIAAAAARGIGYLRTRPAT